MKEKINWIKELEGYALPPEEFLILHSAWLAMMGIRKNRDIDIMMSSKLREEKFRAFSSDETFGLPGEFEKQIRVQVNDSQYPALLGKTIDEIVKEEYIEIDGLHFIKPKHYFNLKRKRIQDQKENFRNMPFWKRFYYKANITGKAKFLPFNDSERKVIKKIIKDNSDLEKVNLFLKTEKYYFKSYDMQPEDWGSC